VIDRHGRLGERDWLSKIQAGDQCPDPDAARIRSHHGQRRRTVEQRVPRPIRLHDGVAVPQHVKPRTFGITPAPLQGIQRHVLVLVGAEAQIGHASLRQWCPQPSHNDHRGTTAQISPQPRDDHGA
jgi:hypothetical protein